MKNLIHSKIIKSISVALSILLIWQGVSYANPDIFQKNTLQNSTLFTGLRNDDAFLAVSAGYFAGYLRQLESERSNHNVSRMKTGIEEVMRELSANKGLDEDKKNDIPEVMQAFTGEGEFVLNAGAFKIRYYNPNVHKNASDPGASFQVIEDKNIGRYLSRQILIQKALAEFSEDETKADMKEYLKIEKDTIRSAYKELKPGEERRIEGGEQFVSDASGKLKDILPSYSNNDGSIKNRPSIGRRKINKSTSFSVGMEMDGSFYLIIEFEDINGNKGMFRMVQDGAGSFVKDWCYSGAEYEVFKAYKELKPGGVMRIEGGEQFVSDGGSLQKGLPSYGNDNGLITNTARIGRRKVNKVISFSVGRNEGGNFYLLIEFEDETGNKSISRMMQDGAGSYAKDWCYSGAEYGVLKAYRELKPGGVRRIEGGEQFVSDGGMLQKGLPSYGNDNGLITNTARIGRLRINKVTSFSVGRNEDGSFYLIIEIENMEGDKEEFYMISDGKGAYRGGVVKAGYEVIMAYRELQPGELRRIEGGEKFINENYGALRMSLPSYSDGENGIENNPGIGTQKINKTTSFSVGKDEDGSFYLRIEFEDKDGNKGVSHMKQDGGRSYTTDWCYSWAEYEVFKAYRELKPGESRLIEGGEKFVDDKGRLKQSLPSYDSDTGLIQRITTIGTERRIKRVTSFFVGKSEDGSFYLMIEIEDREGEKSKFYMIQDGGGSYESGVTKTEYGVIKAYKELKPGEIRIIENGEKLVSNRGKLKQSLPSYDSDGKPIGSVGFIGTFNISKVTSFSVGRDKVGSYYLLVDFEDEKGNKGRSRMVQDGGRSYKKDWCYYGAAYEVFKAYQELRPGEITIIEGGERFVANYGVLNKGLPSYADDKASIGKMCSIGVGKVNKVLSLRVGKKRDGKFYVRINFFNEENEFYISDMIEDGKGAYVLGDLVKEDKLVKHRVIISEGNIRKIIKEKKGNLKAVFDELYKFGVKEGEEYKVFDQNGMEDDLQKMLLNAMGYATLPRVFRGKYAPFTTAPIFEEIAKVGVPFGILAILNLFISNPVLNNGIFAGLLVFFGFGFTMLHALGKRDPPAKVKVLIAPFATAVSGIALALTYISTPSIAILTSMAAHLLINLTVLSFREYNSVGLGYASLENENAENLTEDQKRILDICEKHGWEIKDDNSIREELGMKQGEDISDFAKRNSVFDYYLSFIGKSLGQPGKDLKSLAEEVAGISERAFLKLLDKCGIKILKRLKAKKLSSYEKAMDAIHTYGFVDLAKSLAHSPTELQRVLTILLNSKGIEMSEKEFSKVSIAIALNLGEGAKVSQIGGGFRSDDNANLEYLRALMALKAEAEKLSKHEQFVLIRAFERLTFSRIAREGDKAITSLAKAMKELPESIFFDTLTIHMTNVIEEGLNFQPEHITTELYSHQKVGAWYMKNSDQLRDEGIFGFLMEDDTRMGKTIQTFAAMDTSWKVFIAVPAVVLGTWQQEYTEHTNGSMKIVALKGSPEEKHRLIEENRDKKGVILLHTIEDLKGRTDEEIAMINEGLDLVVIDEAQRIENYGGTKEIEEDGKVKKILLSSNSLQAEAVHKLKPNRTWLLTASPYTSHPKQLFSALSLLHRNPESGEVSDDLYKSRKSFGQLLSRDLKQLKWLYALKARLSLRRTKEDTREEDEYCYARKNEIDPAEENELGHKQGEYLLTLEQSELALKIIRNLEDYIEVYNSRQKSDLDKIYDKDSIGVFLKLQFLKWAIADPAFLGEDLPTNYWNKMDEIVRKRIQGNKKGIIFAFNTRVIREIENRYQGMNGCRIVRIDGTVTGDAVDPDTGEVILVKYEKGTGKMYRDPQGQPIEAKDYNRMLFQQGDADLVVMSVKAGVGLNLSAAEWVLYAQMPDHYVEYYQSSDRAVGRNKPGEQKEIEVFFLRSKYPEEFLKDVMKTEDSISVMGGTPDELLYEYIMGEDKAKFLQVMEGIESSEVMTGHTATKRLVDALHGFFKDTSLARGKNKKDIRVVDATNAFFLLYTRFAKDAEFSDRILGLVDLFSRTDVSAKDIGKMLADKNDLDIMDLKYIKAIFNIPNKYYRDKTLLFLPRLFEKTSKSPGGISDLLERSPPEVMAMAEELPEMVVPLLLVLSAGEYTEEEGSEVLIGILNEFYADGLSDYDRRREIKKYIYALMHFMDVSDGSFLKFIASIKQYILSSDISMENQVALLNKLGVLKNSNYEKYKEIINWDKGPGGVIEYIDETIRESIIEFFGLPNTKKTRSRLMELATEWGDLTAPLQMLAKMKQGLGTSNVRDLNREHVGLFREIIGHIVDGTYEEWRNLQSIDPTGHEIDFLSEDEVFWEDFTNEAHIRIGKVSVSSAKGGKDQTNAISELTSIFEDEALLKKYFNGLSQVIHEDINDEDAAKKVDEEMQSLGHLFQKKRSEKAAKEEIMALQNKLEILRLRKHIITLKGTMREEDMGMVINLLKNIKKSVIRVQETNDIRSADLTNAIDQILEMEGVKEKGRVFEEVRVDITSDPHMIMRRGMLNDEMKNCFNLNYKPEQVATLVDDLASKNKMLAVVWSKGRIAAVAMLKVRQTESGDPVIMIERPLFRWGYGFEREIARAVKQKMAHFDDDIIIAGYCSSNAKGKDKIKVWGTRGRGPTEYHESVFGYRRREQQISHKAQVLIASVKPEKTERASKPESKEDGVTSIRVKTGSGIKDIVGLGHSTRSIDEFITLLKENGVERFVDVRSTPQSRRYPQFNTKNLIASLEKEGVEYLWMGDVLGGKLPEFNDNFPRYMRENPDDRFKGGIEKLLSIIDTSDAPVAVSCSEKDQATCHRRFLLDYLKDKYGKGLNDKNEPQGELDFDSAPQIGKRAHLVDIEHGTDGIFKAKVKDLKGNIHTIDLKKQDTFDIGKLEAVIKVTSSIDQGHKDILLAILERCEKSPPAVYTYGVLIEDLFGFASPKDNLIALHESLATGDKSRIALLHEIGEYLIKNKDLQLEFRDESIIVSIGGNVIGNPVKLTREDAIKQAKKDPASPHYLLRAMQREVFGEKDLDLSQQIHEGQSRGSERDIKEKAIAHIRDVLKKYRPHIIERYERINRLTEAELRALKNDVYDIEKKHFDLWEISGYLARKHYDFSYSYKQSLAETLPDLNLDLLGFQYDWSTEENGIKSIKFAFSRERPDIMARYEDLENLTEEEVRLLKDDIYRIKRSHFGAWGIIGAAHGKFAPYFEGSHIKALQTVFKDLELNHLGFKLEWKNKELAIESVKYTLSRERPDLLERYDELDSLSLEAVRRLKEDIYDITATHFKVWGIFKASQTREAPYFEGKYYNVLIEIFSRLKFNPLGFRLDWSTEERGIESVRYTIAQKRPDIMRRYQGVGEFNEGDIARLKNDISRISSGHFGAWGISNAQSRRSAPYFEGSHKKALVKVFDDPNLGLTEDYIDGFKRANIKMVYAWREGRGVAIKNVRDAIKINRLDIIERYDNLSELTPEEIDLLKRDVYRLNGGDLNSWGIGAAYNKDIAPYFEGSFIRILQIVLKDLNLEHFGFKLQWESRKKALESIRYKLNEYRPDIMERYARLDDLSPDETEILKRDIYAITTGHLSSYDLKSSMNVDVAPYFDGLRTNVLIQAFPRLGLDPLGFRINWSTEENSIASIKYVFSRERPDIVERYDRLEELDKNQIEGLRRDIYSITTKHFMSWGLSGILTDERTPWFNNSYSKAFQMVFPELELDPLGFRRDWLTPERGIASVRFVFRRERPDLMKRYDNIENLTLEEIEELRNDVYNIKAVDFDIMGLGNVRDIRDVPYFEGNYTKAIMSVFDDKRLGLEEETFSRNSALRTKSKTESQMGKRAHIVSIGRGAEGKTEGKVKDSEGDIHTIELAKQENFKIANLKHVIKNTLAVEEGHKEILLAILERFEKSPPDLYIYTTLVEDLFGFARPENNMIALHESLTTDEESVVALIHEIGEYLVEAGKLKFNTENNKITALLDGKVIGKPLELTKEDAKRQMQKNPGSPHYALRALEREIFGEVDLELSKKITEKQLREHGIKDNAGRSINKLVEALIAACQKGEKVVLAVDSELGEGEINRLIRELLDMFPDIKGNNKALKLFLKNLEIVQGEGEALAQHLKNITDSSKSSRKPENVLIIAKSGNLKHFSSFEGKSIITGVDDSVFPEKGYLPLAEVMLFTIGKYLGWDENTLRQHYAMIPNVITEGDLTEEDYDVLFGKGNRTFIIRLIPDAEEIDPEDLRELMDSVQTMLAQA